MEEEEVQGNLREMLRIVKETIEKAQKLCELLKDKRQSS